MLDAYFKTAIHSGGIFNSMPTDIDVSKVSIAQQPNWMTASFMPGRNPVEAPSYIPIELYDYYKATGDATLMERATSFP